MAKINPKELFLTAFRDFNLVRYADSRVDKPRFQGLQLSELAFGELTIDPDTQIGTYEMITSESRRFNAPDQSYIKADLADPGISTVKSTGYPYEDVVTMKALSEPGLIAYMGADPDKWLAGVVFTEDNEGTIESILAETRTIIRAACNYEIPDEEMTVVASADPEVWTLKISNEMIHAEIIVVRSEVPTLDIPATDYGELA